VACHVEDRDAFKDVFIRSIYLDYYANYGTGQPSDHAIRVWPVVGSDNDDETVRSASVEVTEAQLGKNFGTQLFAGGLFYVYVEWGGVPDYSCVPCSETPDFVVGVVPDWRSVYDEGMSHIRAMVPGRTCGCAPKDEFTDFVLRWKALELAIRTCDTDAVRELWDGLFAGRDVTASSSGGCGCKR